MSEKGQRSGVTGLPLKHEDLSSDSLHPIKTQVLPHLSCSEEAPRGAGFNFHTNNLQLVTVIPVSESPTPSPGPCRHLVHCISKHTHNIHNFLKMLNSEKPMVDLWPPHIHPHMCICTNTHDKPRQGLGAYAEDMAKEQVLASRQKGTLNYWIGSPALKPWHS